MYVGAGIVGLSTSTLANNNVQAGNGGSGGSGLFGGNGGRGGNAFGGGFYVAAGNASLSNDTLANNNAQGGKGGNGFGGDIRSGVIFADVGGRGGNGGNAFGGGLYVATGSVSLLSDTLANNNADGGNGGSGGSGPAGEGTGGNGGNAGNGTGGGLFLVSGSVTTLANTLIAENNGTAGTAGAGGHGKYHNGTAGTQGSGSATDVSGTVASSDHDLIGNSSGSGGFSTANGDILNPSFVGLGTLANNGGPTQTLALQTGSAAIDQGDSNAAPGATDQRSYAHIVGSGIDIGSYEYGASTATTDLSVSGNASTAYPGEQLAFMLTVTNNSSSPQSNVALNDLLPANTTLVSWTPAAGWSSSAPAAGSGSGTVSAWTASLAHSASATFTLVVQVNSNAATSTNITDTASVGPLTGDPNVSNNSVIVNAPVQSLADQLIAEIAADNLAGGTHTITLMPNALYVLNTVNNRTNEATGLPIIAAGDNLTIVGNGATIERNPAYGTPAFRLFDVDQGASLTLQNLTLSHGLVYTGAGNAPAEGGAIYSSGHLKLSGVTVQSNTAQGVTASGREYAVGGQAFGGGLYVAAGTVTLTNAALNDNNADGGVGGNASGGGLYVASGTVTLTNNTLSDNNAHGGSGFSGQGSSGSGGSGGSGFGGGLYVAAGNVTLTDNTLSNNNAHGGIGGSGNYGGLGYSGGMGGTGGSGGNAFGGGLYVAAGAGTITLSNDTLSGNNANGGTAGAGNVSFTIYYHTNLGYYGGSGGSGGSGTGGGLFVVKGSALTLANTLIAGNNVTAGLGGAGAGGVVKNGISGSSGRASAPDVSGALVSSDHDLIGDGTGSNLTNGSHGDQVGSSTNPLDPKLGPLQNNGGPTLTMALLAGSLAIDAGDSNAAPGATDQRGYAHRRWRPRQRHRHRCLRIRRHSRRDHRLVHQRQHPDDKYRRRKDHLHADRDQQQLHRPDQCHARRSPASQHYAGIVDTCGRLEQQRPGRRQQQRHGVGVDRLVGQQHVGHLHPDGAGQQTAAAGTVINNTASVGPPPEIPTPATTASPSTPPCSEWTRKRVLRREGESRRLPLHSGLKEFVQTLTITNTSATALNGPLALELTGLSSNAALANQSSTTGGNPYLDFVAAANALAPGQSVSVILEFSDPSRQSITYGTTVLQGI